MKKFTLLLVVTINCSFAGNAFANSKTAVSICAEKVREAAIELYSDCGKNCRNLEVDEEVNFFKHPSGLVKGKTKVSFEYRQDGRRWIPKFENVTATVNFTSMDCEVISSAVTEEDRED